MAVDIELLRAQPPIAASQALLTALAAAMRAAGDDVVETTQYRGGRPLLTLCGVGALAHHAARMAQVAAGGRALLWDLGYTGRLGEGG